MNETMNNIQSNTETKRSIDTFIFCVLCFSTVLSTTCAHFVYYYPQSIIIAFLRLAGVAIFDAMALFSFLIYGQYPRKGFGKKLFLLGIIILIAYTIIIPCIPSYQTVFKDLLQMVVWVLTFIVYYLFFLNHPRYSRYFICLFPISVAINSMIVVFLDYYPVVETEVNVEEVTTVFFVTLLFSGCMFMKKKFLRNIIILIIFVITVLSLKRSLNIACSLTLFIYFYAYNGQKKNVGHLLVVLCIIAMIVAFAIESTYGEQVIERFNDIKYDRGSGRVDIYNDLWHELKNRSTTKEILIGHGTLAVQLFFSTFTNQEFRSAHNDFLELLYDFGVFVLMLYLWFHVLILRFLFSLKKKNSEYFAIFLSAWVYFIILSFISHLVIYPTYPVYLFSIMGMIVALDERDYSFKNDCFVQQIELPVNTLIPESCQNT